MQKRRVVFQYRRFFKDGRYLPPESGWIDVTPEWLAPFVGSFRTTTGNVLAGREVIASLLNNPVSFNFPLAEWGEMRALRIH